MRGDPRRHQSVRRHVGRQAAARRDRRRLHAPLRRAGRSRDDADHRLLRLHRSHDRDDAGHRRSGRRGHRLRAVLRELRSRRDPVRRDAALRAAARAGRAAATGRSTPTSSRAAFSNRTRAIIINTPNNPTGKVFTRDGARGDRRALPASGTSIAVTDEIYEHILYDGATHVPMASLDGMADRTVTINSVSKTFSVTGWRVGWTIAPPDMTGGDPQGARFSDGRRGGAAAGRRRRGARRCRRATTASSRPRYRARRDRLLTILRGAGLRRATTPRGAYYIMTDIARVRIPGRRRVRAASGDATSASRPCPAAASTATRRRAAPRCASVSARRTRR